jgi:hypothetical protein
MVCSLYLLIYLFITFFLALYVETFVGLRSLIGTPSPALHIAKFFFGGWALRGAGSILWHSQSGYDPWEDLAKSGYYKAKYESD